MRNPRSDVARSRRRRRRFESCGPHVESVASLFRGTAPDILSARCGDAELGWVELENQGGTGLRAIRAYEGERSLESDRAHAAGRAGRSDERPCEGGQRRERRDAHRRIVVNASGSRGSGPRASREARGTEEGKRRHGSCRTWSRTSVAHLRVVSPNSRAARRNSATGGVELQRNFTMSGRVRTLFPSSTVAMLASVALIATTLASVPSQLELVISPFTCNPKAGSLSTQADVP